MKNLFRTLRYLLTGATPKQPKATSSYSSVNLNPQQSIEQIQPDIRGAKLVDPAFVHRVTAERMSVLVCENRFFVFADRKGVEFDKCGESVREFELPDKLISSLAVQPDLYLVLGHESHWLWTPSQAMFQQVTGKTNCATALRWVGDNVVVWSEERDDDEYSHHSEKSYYEETVYTLDLKKRKLTKSHDQSMGGALVMHHYATRYSSRTTSRLSPESKFQSRAEDPVGFSATCGLTPGKKTPLSLYFSGDPPNGYAIGTPHYHLSAFPHFSEHPKQTSNGRFAGDWAFTKFSNDHDHTIVVWNSQDFQVLPCSDCGEKVSLSAAVCPCGSPPPPSGVIEDSVKPGQLRFADNFDELWEHGLKNEPYELPERLHPDHSHLTAGFITTLQQYGSLKCSLSIEAGKEEVLVSSELRPFYGTTFRYPIVDTKNRCLWALDCKKGPLRFALDPGVKEFAQSYEKIVRKPESYFSFLGLYLSEDYLFIQGDFFMTVCRVKGQNLKHLSTTDNLGKLHGYELSIVDSSVTIKAQRSPGNFDVRTHDGKGRWS